MFRVTFDTIFGAFSALRQYSSSKRILDVLETIYLIFRKTTVVQGVAVVKLGVCDGGGNCFGGVKFKIRTDTAKSTDVMVAGFRQCRDLIRE